MEFQLPLPAKVAVDQMRELWTLARVEYEKARAAEIAHHTEFLRLYHLLERMPPLSGSEGYKVAKQLRETLILRRQAKWDKDTWNWVFEFTHGHQMAFHKMVGRVERQNQSCIEYIREGPVENYDAEKDLA